jgi:riboflavin transporter
MSIEKTFTIDRAKIVSLTQFAALIGIATIVPLFHQQMITGPIVNATLFAAAVILGTQMGIFVGLIPSIIALSVGTLPAPLAPMVPYIMLSNALLILAFNAFREKNYWLAIGVASVIKFVFLWAMSSVVIGLLMKKELAESVALMMSWPQLLTALLGGALAVVFLHMYKRQ